MTEITVVADHLSGITHVFAVVAAEAAREIKVADVIRVRLPISLHFRKRVSPEDSLHFTDGRFDRLILVGLALSGIDAASYRLSDEMFSYEPYALMMRRDADFKVAVDRELARLYRSGDILNLYGRWYGPLGEPSTLLKAMYFLNSMPE